MLLILLEKRTGHSAVLLSDQRSILIYGGWDTNEKEERLFNDAFILDTKSWSWSPVEANAVYWDGYEDNGDNRVGHSSILMPSGQDVLSFGGRLQNDRFANDFQIILNYL